MGPERLTFPGVPSRQVWAIGLLRRHESAPGRRREVGAIGRHQVAVEPANKGANPHPVPLARARASQGFGRLLAGALAVQLLLELLLGVVGQRALEDRAA